ncbi:DUF4239 domain-containing protein [Methyloligella sp. 2.7D]|uniref:bestrophin-like domain n=1 Tax=unclassified Methyloligella TaxID=2625955 RepID=UPI00157DDEFA|nr:DUF4239 domain-containing protein [Methyloligella sp. GL2]QKP77912.1 DUF4239 domain-containing protein [Methyloligella sp. GL2]
MSLLHLLNQAPILLAVLLTLALVEAYSIGLILLFRRIWGPHRLKLNNEVGGLKFAAISVLYAVLLGFVAIAVWEDYKDTASAVRDEAAAVRDLLQLSYAMPKAQAEQIRAPLVAYAEHVRKREWPAMAEGRLHETPADHLARLEQSILNLKAEDFRELALYQEAVRLLAVVHDNRSERVENSEGSVAPILWLALFGGAMIVLGYPAIFGTPSQTAQIAMAAAMAAMVGFVMLPTLLLNYPFTGPVRISDRPFAEAVKGIPPHAEVDPR